MIGGDDPKCSCANCVLRWGRPSDNARFISDTVDSIAKQSLRRAFRSEGEIQGFMFHRLQRFYGDVVSWDRPTENGFRRKDALLNRDPSGRKGHIDFVYNDLKGKKVGIEIEYPRGTGKEDPELYRKHIINDVTKLSEGSSLDERYILVFAYQSPPVDLEELGPQLNDANVNLGFFLLGKKNEKMIKGARGREHLKEIVELPGEWLPDTEW